MSFLDYTDLDPHIHLFILNNFSGAESQELSKQKVHHLLRTRRFEQLLAEAKKIENLEFPNLQSNIQSAKNSTQNEKIRLGINDIEAKLKKLDEQSNKQDANLDEVDEEQLNCLKLAKILYDEGKYQQSLNIIKQLQKQLLNDSLYIKTTWARLYCEIFIPNSKIKRTIERLKTKIDQYEERQKSDRKSMGFAKSNQSIKASFARRKEFLALTTIIYFLDWKDEGFQKYINYCSQQENSAVIQTSCSYLIRYISIALILNKAFHKNRKFDLFTLVEALKRKVYKYTDPFVEFLTSLFIEFDFQQTKEKINDIKACIRGDPLLRGLEERIIQNCYFLFFKVYCKVHEKVSFSEIAQLISKSEEDAELWILGFIRSLDIEAKIDSVERAVFSYREEESLNEKYIDLIPKINSFINTLSQSKNPEV